MSHPNIAEIRNLDSDRKSLVYDNYSKLLSATSTIRRMRTNMDPLAPTTHTLSPAISHIAETAAQLSTSMHSLPQKPSGLGIDVRVEGPDGVSEAESASKANQKNTVKWVLNTPVRLRSLSENGKLEEAEKEWEEISRLLDKWTGVAGVDELRQECQAILMEGSEGAGEL